MGAADGPRIAKAVLGAQANVSERLLPVHPISKRCETAWAYAKPHRSSASREAALQPFIDHYNWHRPHSALAHQPPMIRIPAVNHLLGLNNPINP
jgi:transposase InsO family protein